CEEHVYQQRWLLLKREKTEELDRAFIPPFDDTDFRWTGELFVARQPFDRVPKRPRGKRGEFNRVVALDAILGPQFQAKTRIVAGFRNSSVKGEELLGAHQDLVRVRSEEHTSELQSPDHLV